MDNPRGTLEINGIEKVWFAGCFISKISKSQVLVSINHWLRDKEKNHCITAINVSKLVMMQHDKKLADYVCNSSVNIADGFPIYLAPKLLGQPIPDRITGIELMEELFALSDKHGYRIYLFGANPEVLKQVVEKCSRDYPGIVIAGSQNGYFKKNEESRIVRNIGASKPDILFIALGLPQKEYFVAEHLAELNSGVLLPVGGAFDVYAGVKPRAPAWIQKIGIEWLWRSFFDRTRAILIYRSIFFFLMLFAKEFCKKWILRR